MLRVLFGVYLLTSFDVHSTIVRTAIISYEFCIACFPLRVREAPHGISVPSSSFRPCKGPGLQARATRMLPHLLLLFPVLRGPLTFNA